MLKENVEITKALYNYVDMILEMSRFSDYIDSITVRLNVNNKIYIGRSHYSKQEIPELIKQLYMQQYVL